MSEVTYYRLVCDRHTPPIVLADITHDPDGEAARNYEHQVARWDRHARGEESVLDNFGRPYPPHLRPHLPRDSSRTITVHPHEHLFVPELVDKSGPRDINELLKERADAALAGERPPHRHDGYVRTATSDIGSDEDTDGHKITIACEMCKKLRDKHLRMPPTSAGTLAIVLKRLASRLPSERHPLHDGRTADVIGEVDVRIVTLAELAAELGSNPRGMDNR